MLGQKNGNDTEAAQLPRNKDGSIRKTFVKSVARGIEAADASSLRALVGGLHESDMGALIEALDAEQRPRLVELLG
ncbi:MAG: magnesium transporter, partial [Pseudolabrys sp.]